jgi:Flp pilus assembly CpaF family ATPase
MSTTQQLVRLIANALADDRVTRHKEDRLPASLDEEKTLARTIAQQHLRVAHLSSDWDSAQVDESSDEVIDEAINLVLGLGRLEPLLADDEISDIHVRGNSSVWVKLRTGERREHEPIVDTDDELIELIRRMAARMGHREQRFDPAHPELNLQLGDGSRVFATMEVSARPSLVIRKHRFEYSDLSELVNLGMLDELTARFLSAAVRSRQNLVVSGGTGSGKTTLLRALINEIPRSERIVTIEDAFEIGLERFADAHPDHDSLQARLANSEGSGSVTMSDLARMALRMDPDRVVVGEVRGAEAFPMLLAMSQGNNGSMCTMHADSPRSVFPKLLSYVSMGQTGVPMEAVNLLISTSIHFVIQLQLVNGQRRIVSIHEVVHSDGSGVASNEVFSLYESGSNFVTLRVKTQQALEQCGFSAAGDAAWAR